ncbi:MAG TPA: molybdenum cofactor biosynthesis protein MoaE [Intrasporangium sp.]|uniref:molybdenum cofactor biosynthesis protein MoaE n=1 Tax=Intrasporangium sp. TaxID=1925024 RepID=UPI002B489FEF|nr:molybdenum cofactor biosynthesis protein MoaE [Intrasporangium sp.]HKX68920.1 molybdenum cofactor biosynthesis protein MoaE [Intrasporangium sp.]
MAGVTVTLAEIRESPLSVDEVLSSVADARAGGTCVFVGTVRNHDAKGGAAGAAADQQTDKERVLELDYSAHPQAEEVTRALAERLAADGRTVRIAVVHRVGRLDIGDLAVVVAVSAEHRGAAFEVCRELIDELKATVPIWKHQRFADGSDEWVGLP